MRRKDGRIPFLARQATFEGMSLMTPSELTALMAATAGLIHVSTPISKPIIEEGVGLFHELLGKPLQIAGGMIQDQVYAWRLARGAEAFAKTAKVMRELGVKPKQLPPGFLIPFFEAASVADDEDIHDLFANLLAAAVAADVYQHPIFRHALSQMNADEARILRHFGQGNEIDVFCFHGRRSGKLISGTIFRDPEIGLAQPKLLPMWTDNLTRLGMVLVGDWETGGPTPDWAPQDWWDGTDVLNWRAPPETTHGTTKLLPTIAGEKLCHVAAGVIVEPTSAPRPG
jgi:hypothetical protein